jgi:hypothetical protein
VRASLKIRGKAPLYVIGWVGLGLFWSAPGYAQSEHVGDRCPRLSNAEYEELDARVLLLLKSEGGAERLPTVVCGDGGSWVAWHDRRFTILGRAPIADEVVDIIEAELQDTERRFAADARIGENGVAAAGVPVLQPSGAAAAAPAHGGRRADPIALRAADARGGGIALGLETELPSDSISTSMGPTFDFGTSVGPLILGGREAFRFSVGGRSVSFMDFEGAVAYGAPFNPDAPLGAVVRFGAEWMVAYPEGNSAQAAVVPMVDCGIRAAHSFGLLGFWFGLDAHVRLADLSLRSRSPLIANAVGGSLTLGVSFVDWSRK